MKISVITINLNGNRYLAETIDSVLMQHSVELEYLIIDGGSTDGSRKTVADASERDARIEWISEADNGISNAMNRGIARATGEIVAFLHSDDYYHRNDILSTVTDVMEDNPDSLWCTGGILEVDSSGNVLSEYEVRRFSRQRLLRNNILFHPATFVRRAFLIRTGGFDESLNYAMDYDLWLRLSVLSTPVEVHRLLASFRVHSQSISTKNRLAALNEEYQVRKRHLKEAVTAFPHAVYQFIRVALETIRPGRI